MSDEQFEELAQKYMEKMGYGNQPFIVYKHEDIERKHIHIITTNVDKQGRKISDSNNFYLNKKVCRELEDQFNLKAVDSKRQQQSFDFKRVDASKNDVKNQISNIIKPLAAIYQFQSFGEYRTLLSKYNICVEEVKGERNGKPYTGMVYYATDNEGKKISNPFKSSLFGKTVGYDAIYQKIEKHKTTIKDKKQNAYTAKRVAFAIRGKYTKQEVIDSLKAQNIDVIFRENEQGRIYGVTFIDNNNRCVFNGSRLGKEFSANAFELRFSGAWKDENYKKSESSSESKKQWQKTENSFEPKEQTNSEWQPSDKSSWQNNSNDSVVSSLGGIFDFPSTNADDPEEERFRKRMQRKKKRKGRRM